MTTASRYSLLTRDQLVATIDANTRSMEWFARELALLQKKNGALQGELAAARINSNTVFEQLRAERDAARADAEMYRRLLAMRGQTCPIQLVVHKS